MRIIYPKKIFFFKQRAMGSYKRNGSRKAAHKRKKMLQKFFIKKKSPFNSGNALVQDSSFSYIPVSVFDYLGPS